MHGRDGEAVTGHPDEANQPFGPGFDGRFQRATLSERGLPLDDVHQVVELDEIDPVDSETLERSMDLVLGPRVVAFSRLRCQEEGVRALLQPGCDAKLGIPVGRCRVDVVDSMLQHKLQRPLCLGMGCFAERCCTEERPGALVSGAPELRPGDHLLPGAYPHPEDKANRGSPSFVWAREILSADLASKGV